MTNIELAVYDITKEFVDEVKKSMINKYLQMLKTDSEKYMIETLLEKYYKENCKAEEDRARRFEMYISGNSYKGLEVFCLIHDNYYKRVIQDILQCKL